MRGICLKIRRRYFCRHGHFKNPICETPAETRGFVGAIKTGTQDVHSIHISENEGKIKKIIDLQPNAHVRLLFRPQYRRRFRYEADVCVHMFFISKWPFIPLTTLEICKYLCYTLWLSY
jgi:hypothetical protein